MLTVVIGILSILISAVAAIMISVFFYQWQKPDINVEFHQDIGAISCRIRNLPHTERWLEWLQRNTVERLTAHISVIDLNVDNPLANELIVGSNARLIILEDVRPFREKVIKLVSSPTLYAHIHIAYLDSADNKILILDADEKCAREVTDNGKYRVNIELHADNKIIRETRDFVIDYWDRALYVKWMEKDVKT